MGGCVSMLQLMRLSLRVGGKYQISYQKFCVFGENIENGNLFVMNVRTLSDCALNGDLNPFLELKVLLEDVCRQRILTERGDGVMFFADIAGTMSLNRHFYECIRVEKWWEKTFDDWKQNGHNITVVHPHPYPVLSLESTRREKSDILSAHSHTV